MSRKNGGIIGPANTPVGGLMKGVAGGVWRMNDVLDFVSNSQWPSAPQDIENSLRFNRGSSDSLERTPSSAGNRRTFTFSCWFKLGKIASSTSDFYQLFGQTDASGSSNDGLWIDSNDRLYVFFNSGERRITNQKLRDPSSWYHVVLAIDTTQSTASNRIKLYLNGSEITSFSTNTDPTLNHESGVNNTSTAYIGERINDDFFDGYMTEVVMIDGQQLDPTSFGEFDEDSPTIWKPKNVSGLTFGTNGFHLDFENASSLGADVSGNGNNFTVNNLTSIDQSTDTCTNNFATLNPIAFKEASDGQMSEGNLKFSSADASLHNLSMSTFSVDTGKYYWEVQLAGTINNYAYIGIRTYESLSAASKNQYLGEATGGISLRSDGYYNVDGSFPSQFSGISYGSGDIISVGLDLDNNKIYWYENGTLVNSGGTTITNRLYAPGISLVGNNGIANFNFGSPSFSISSGNSDANGHGNFEYAPPSGFFALCTKNLAEFG